MKKVFILFLLSLSFDAFAERVVLVSKIDRLHSYSEQEGFDGDVAIKVLENLPGCEGGFWLRSATT